MKPGSQAAGVKWFHLPWKKGFSFASLKKHLPGVESLPDSVPLLNLSKGLARMNLEEIQELIAVMRKNRIKEIDLDQDGAKLRIVACEVESKVKEAPAAAASQPAPYPFPMYFAQGQSPFGMPSAPQQAIAPGPDMGAQPATASPAAPLGLQPSPQAAIEEPVLAGTEIKSPMVGTFYRAPAPGAPVYVEVGAVVSEDSVLCIVEAMKLMNEIKAEVRGKILKILVKNGEPVEYGQPLFLIEAF